MITVKKRVLPAEVYDTLEFAALAFGGIGSGMDFEWTPAEPGSYSHKDDSRPCCIHGIAIAASSPTERAQTELNDALFGAKIGRTANDEAVNRVRTRLGSTGRITFAQWVKELNVVRGEESAAA